MKFNLEIIDDLTRLSYGNKGYIDFRIEENFLIWDCYTYKQYRGQGVFKTLLDELNNRYPNKTFCASVANKKIIKYLEKLGYKKTLESLPYWGKPSNCKNYIKINENNRIT